MKKYICLDIDDKRIGIAVSDPLGSMALPYDTLHRKNFNEDLKKICEIAKSRGADVIVCGLPVNFDGSKSEQTLKTETFIEELKKVTEIPVEIQDERFTTREAHRVLISENMRRDKRKMHVDAVAASFILEDYMRKQNLK